MASKKLFTRLGVLAASSAMVVTLAPSAQAAPVVPDAADKPSTVQTDGVQRVSGANRHEVSVNAAELALKDGQATGTTFVLASGYIWPDAITVTPLSGCEEAPVLLTKKDQLTPEVTAFLKTQAATAERIIISGGPATISPKVEAQVMAALPGVVIERNGGADRQAVAYNNAAQAAECYLDGTAIQTAHRNLFNLKQAEARYQAAVLTYSNAVDAYDAAQAKDAALAKQIQDLQEQINTIADTLTPAPGFDQAAYDAALAAWNNAATAQNAAVAQAAIINKLGTLQDTTRNLESTLGEYRALLNVTENAALTQAQTRFGLGDTSTLNQAIAAVNTTLDGLQDTTDAAAATLAEQQRLLMASAAANAANAPKLAQIGKLQAQLKAAQDARTAHQLVLADALAKLQTATATLQDALANRPRPGAIATATQALETARDNAVKAAGKAPAGVPAFLTTGTVYSDALTTGPAAFNTGGVVLLSKGANLGPSAMRWKTNFAATRGDQIANGQYVAVGGEAIRAVKGDATWTTVPGKDRYDVSVALAQKFFKGAVYPTVASGEISSDATVGGSFSALYNNPLLLTKQADLPSYVDNYLRNSNSAAQPSAAVIMGGPSTVSREVSIQIDEALAVK
ncbi:MAG: cell wall-binding repeat-containing protein [Luteococcus sp.]|uniref:cell wall-binding repeat-containing protein n=1 Tax=Luteococcus sp. TaxID=1969402 RepID=UPI002649DCEC|nr:cell wall-binding repeat-containing protein [Luteococcus sp.]MDN5564788.1 cell wall-binding repeat-containing protein [Luteococcus sp.]